MASSSYSQTDKLLQVQVQEARTELVSAFGRFQLGFFNPKDSVPGTTCEYGTPANLNLNLVPTAVTSQCG